MVGDNRQRLAELPDRSVHCCVTSPPYFGLRDYGHDGQIGLEPTPDEFVGALMDVFREVRRVLRDDGTVWLNLGDSYGTGAGRKDTDEASLARRAGLFGTGTGAGTGPREFIPMRNPYKPKDLLGIPWMVAFALRADGWYLRSDIIWAKPNPMPESVTDRPTKGHEYLFLLSKQATYFYDADAIRERHVKPAPVDGPESGTYADGSGRMDSGKHVGGGLLTRQSARNKRSVWTVATQPYAGAHFATFPPKLIEPCILAGCPEGGTVLDPFAGAGTTGLVSLRRGRSFVGIELNPAYAEMARERIRDDAPLLNTASEEEDRLVA
jgi:DNA modification methylase